MRKNNGLAETVLKTQQTVRTGEVQRRRGIDQSTHQLGALDAQARGPPAPYNGPQSFIELGQP